MRTATVLGISLAALALIGALAGCSAKQAPLPHAVYANAVPIYPGATLEDAMGSTSAGDTAQSDGMAWYFDVQAPADAMISYYMKKLPGVKRDAVWQEGVRLVWIPPGASPGEEVALVIGDNELTIHEEVKPGKRAGNPNAASQDVEGSLSTSVPDSETH